MSLFEDAMAVAVQLPMADRERLGRALGLNVHTKGGPGKTLPLNQFVNRPDISNPQAWRARETGHAVLDTERAEGSQPPPIENGPRAIQGMWSHFEEAVHEPGQSETPNASSLARNHPVVVHTGVATDLAVGREEAIEFWNSCPVEPRLATASYLALLGAAENDDQVARIRAFVQPYAVLSLGPMASSRAAELMLLHASSGLSALDALVAATALAHETPLVVREPGAFAGIAELQVVKYF